MREQLMPGLRIMLFFTAVLGVIYPLAMTGAAQLLFPGKANGSLVRQGDRVIGSELIAQNFTRPEYFHPRPSAAGNGFDATNSGGTNLGPTNPKLAERVKAAIEQFRKENPDYTGPIPADLVTTSASGLDPHISPDSANAQAARVAKARNMPMERVQQLIAQSTERPTFGFLGEPRVNVLKLNIALGSITPAP